VVWLIHWSDPQDDLVKSCENWNSLFTNYEILIQIYILTGKQMCLLKVSSLQQQEVLKLLNFQIHQRPETSLMQDHAPMVNVHVQSLKLWCAGVKQLRKSGCLTNTMVKFATSSMPQTIRLWNSTSQLPCAKQDLQCQPNLFMATTFFSS